MEFTYDGLVRYGFGFYNPNHAAALITMIIPVLWGLRRYFNGIPAKAAIVCVEIIFYIALVLTYSRAGIVALALSALFFYTLTHFYLKHEPIRIFKRKITKEVFILCGIGIFVVFTALMAGSIERYFKWIISPDKSVTNRVAVWRGALQMIADNPEGVGTGYSGRIYTEMMQSPESGTTYRTMVNSFLTFICEQGIITSAIAGGMLVFAAIMSFNIIRKKESDFKTRLMYITLLAIVFSGAVSGMFSTCFDLSVVTDAARCAADSNIIMQNILLLLFCSAVSGIIFTGIKHMNFSEQRKILLTALATTMGLCATILICGFKVGSKGVEKVYVYKEKGGSYAQIVPWKKNGKSFLVFPDGNDAGIKEFIKFIKLEYGAAKITFPLSSNGYGMGSDRAAENDYVVVCGSNSKLLKSGSPLNWGKAKIIVYCPTELPEASLVPIHKVYLKQYDEYGINEEWEKKYGGIRQTEYCY